MANSRPSFTHELPHGLAQTEDDISDSFSSSDEEPEAAPVIKETREIRRRALQQQRQYENALLEHRHRNFLDITITIVNEHTRKVFGVLVSVALVVLFTLWMVFQFSFRKVKVDDIHVYNIFKLLFVIVAVATAAYLLIWAIMSLLKWILQSPIFLDDWAIRWSLVLLIVGIVMLASFRPLTEHEIDGDCGKAKEEQEAEDRREEEEARRQAAEEEKARQAEEAEQARLAEEERRRQEGGEGDAPADEQPANNAPVEEPAEPEEPANEEDDGDALIEDTTVEDEEVCFSWLWAFTSAIVVGACWFVRSMAEEIALFKLGVRSDLRPFLLALQREQYLQVLVKYMRARRVIPRKSDPRNAVPGLRLHGRVLSNGNQLFEALREHSKLYHRALVGPERPKLIAAIQKQSAKMFVYLDRRVDGYLTPDSFKPVFGATSHTAFAVFDHTITGKISNEQFQSAVVSILDARVSAWSSLSDRRIVAATLRSLIGIVFWAVMLVTVIVIGGVSSTTTILPLVSLVLGLSFAFGAMLRTLVNTFVLLLFEQPFDVGHKIKIGAKANPSFYVVRMGLFRTKLYGTDGIFYSTPNTDLLTNPIINMNKSKEATIILTLQLAHAAPGSSVIAFMKSMEDYLQKNKDTYDADDSAIYIDKIINCHMLVIELWIPLKRIHWVSFADWVSAQTELYIHIQHEAKRLGLTLKELPQRVEVHDAPERGRGRSASRSRARTSTIPRSMSVQSDLGARA